MMRMPIRTGRAHVPIWSGKFVHAETRRRGENIPKPFVLSLSKHCSSFCRAEEKNGPSTSSGRTALMFQYSHRVSASPREPFSFAIPLRSPISPAAGRFDHDDLACFELCAAGGGAHFDPAVGAFAPVRTEARRLGTGLVSTCRTWW